MADPGDGAALIDWGLAASVARKLAPPGPQISPDDAAAAVADLYQLAEEATAHVERVTQLHSTRYVNPTAVVDRPGWIDSNVEGLRWLARPLLDKIAEQRPPSRLARATSRKAAGMQVGAALAFLSTKVLGQYEIFLPDSPSGRLALVAPNIVGVERSLGADSRDFRMWVALHEQTHRLQFTAVPWLRGYLETLIRQLADATELDPSALAARLRGVARSLRTGETTLIEALQTPEQRIVLDRIQALMTLLEGHADWAMDAAGEGVIGSLEQIRGSLDERREKGSGVLDILLRKIFGLDAKMAQYKQGGAFVRSVVEASGVAGLNTVWESAATLPTRAELADPTSWLRRALGSAAVLPA